MIDLADYQGGLFHCLPGYVYCGPEAAIARLVRRCDLDKGCVDPDGSGFNEVRDSGKGGRDKIHTAGSDGLTGNPPGKKGLESKFLRILFRNRHGLSQAHELYEF